MIWYQKDKEKHHNLRINKISSKAPKPKQLKLSGRTLCLTFCSTHKNIPEIFMNSLGLFFILRFYLRKAVLYMNYYLLLIIFSSTWGLVQFTDSSADNLQSPYRCCQCICRENDDYFPLRRWDHSTQTYIRSFILNLHRATQHALPK